MTRILKSNVSNIPPRRCLLALWTWVLAETTRTRQELEGHASKIAILVPTESRYAIIELGCLAASWAIDNCRQFPKGLPAFKLVTDHRQPVPILNDYQLDKLENPRLLCLRLKMQRFSFVARWVPRKSNKDADALSHAPIAVTSPTDDLDEGMPFPPARVPLLCAIERSEQQIIDPVLEKIKAAASSDPIMKKLRETIIQGFPNDKCNLDDTIQPFWNVRHQLAFDDSDDMIVLDARTVIPNLLRKVVLQDLLLKHQGLTKIRQRTRMSVYLPNMDVKITNATR